jgi:metal-responsive CopG/Arc/MetJ family transcriptional regulator
MSTKKFNISLPKELVEVLDLCAKKDNLSRSNYIRKSVVNQMRSDNAVEDILNTANKKGVKLGIVNEQQIYSIIASVK